MTEGMIILLFAFAAAGVVWYFVGDLRIKAGWQNCESPLARWLDARRRRAFDFQLPDALMTMTNALRAGFSIQQAFEAVVEQGEKPIGEEFAILQQQLRLGMSFDEALASLAERVGSDDLRLVTTALLISRKTGGNVTEVFDKISHTIRGRMKIERKVRTLTAQGRMQGIVITAMPFLLALAMTIVKPKMMIPFFLSPFGVVSVLVAVTLITLGWLCIRKIITIDV